MSLTGQTGCGKTTLIRRLLKHKSDLFEPEPTEIMYCYGVYQKAYDEMQHDMPEIKFYGGMPNESVLNDFLDGSHKCIIYDDMMQSIVKSGDMENMFTKYSHHRNCSVIYINQNVYCPGKHSRTINLNTQYYICMSNPRDVSTMKVMGRQLGMGNALYEAYTDVHKKPYSYLVVDLSPHSQAEYKLWTKIFPNEDTVIYKV